MARARNIKPGFFTNDKLGELPPLARLLFAGLWTLCDRAGRVEDRPKKIRAELLPYDDCDGESMLAMLCESGFIARYEANGKRVIQVLAWDKHQNPHVKEAPSTLPAQGEHCASPVQAPEIPERAGLIPDSGFLIPDSKEEKPARKRAIPPPCPEDVNEAVWDDWLALRKGKRAAVTPTVISEARSEAAKAGMRFSDFLRLWCVRGSQGLSADWLKPHERGSPGTAEPQWRTEQRQRTQAFAGRYAAKPTTYEPETIDAAPPLLD